jgi:hypothetical protein
MRELGEVMGQAARSLQQCHGDVEATLQAITSTAVGSIPGAEEATITYVSGRRSVEPRAVTGDLPRRVDETQDLLQEGPCLDSVWAEKAVRSTTCAPSAAGPASPPRPPRWGVLSSLSLQLFVEGDNLGALNVYARTPQVSVRTQRTSDGS